MPPIYDFKCGKCETVKERYAKIEERVTDCDCGGKMKRLITTRYYAQGDIKPYLDEHLTDRPVWVESRQHRKKLMKQYGVYEAHGKGWV